MSDTFDVNSPEALVMRLHEALEDLGKDAQGIMDMGLNLFLNPEDEPVDQEVANYLSRVARLAGAVQGMATILDALGYAADR